MHEIPEALRRGPVTSAQARVEGVGWRVLQSRRFRKLFPYVYLHRELFPTPDVWLRAAALKLPGDAVVSGVSAARVWGFDPRGHHELHFSTRQTTRTTRLPGVTLHRHGSPIAMALVDGVTVTSPARTVVDCARRLGYVQLVQLADHLIHVGALSRDELDRTVHRHRWHGVRRVRRALAWIREGAESPMETLVRLMLVHARLPEPELNVDVLDAAGRFVARVCLPRGTSWWSTTVSTMNVTLGNGSATASDVSGSRRLVTASSS